MSDSSSDLPEKPGPFASISANTGKPASQSPKKKKKKNKRSGLWRLFRWIIILGFIAGAATGIGGCVYYNGKALTFDMKELKQVPQRTLVFDRNGEQMGHVSGHGENRLVVPASEVSEHFIKALLAREDSRFYDHDGVDYRGLARAVVANFKARGMEQGASTLTMQLARNTFGMREKSLNRKFMEVALAKRIERKYTKEEILGFYMNRVYFGSGLYGIERASQGYFMKPASDLSPGEGAMLAGVIRGPSLLNPFRSMENATDIRDEVLARLVTEGTITEEQSTAAKNEKITLRPPEQRLATGSYVLQSIFDLIEGFKERSNLSDEDIQRGGLKIYTTIDATMQAAAEKALDDHLTSIEKQPGFKHPPRSAHKEGGATNYLQGSVVSIDNRDGAIRALVGGRNFGESAYNRAFQSARQVGSTFKPFVYAVAFDRGGLLPGAYISDDALRIDMGGGAPIWSPKNSDGTFTGLQPAAIGLIRSRNTMSVRVGQIAGLDNVRSLANALQLGELPNSPVSYLGAFETSNYALTSAYSVLAARGTKMIPYMIERIELPNGETIQQHQVTGITIFPESVAYITSEIMGETMDNGTGAGARRLGFKAPAYGKTGTTNDYRDAWFVGFTDKITTGVWVGLDQPKTIMNRGYGSTLALPVWTEVMKAAETAGFPGEKIPAPEGTDPRLICRECGLNASNRTQHVYQMDLPNDLRPRSTCRGHGMGIFSRNNGDPQAFPFGEDPNAMPQDRRPPTDDGIGRALRGIGRFIFGGGR
ncbi:PBP1A family penicillin-binding protein [Verrucomicrobiales bacterium BCK34]|nr:PBP1A family penicillin-binding protein [Verrucomicrobiales bacterium BCK34]